jgi:two-component system nitrogen regulation response regulator GlnG
MVDEGTTRAPTNKPPRGVRRRVLALTILAHPDPRRVGEIAFPSAAFRLSRLEPDFGDTATPLAVPHLSRRPIKIAVRGEEVVFELDPEAAGVRVDGRGAGARVVLPRSRLDQGIVLELADRVALLVHQRAPPRCGATSGLLGASEAIEQLRDEVARVADLATPVCLIGETGTGKELTAAAIHACSGREGPFVAINMAGVASATAVSQLFGHVRGAFTGADAAHRGVFRQAHGGTLLLDEIGECSEEVQSMLLRVLETSEVVPLGAERSERVDVRVVAATDRNLEELIKAGTFREPLWHRIAGYVIRLPPLRVRRDDIARLFYGFLREELATFGELDRLDPQRDPPWLAADVVGALCRADWPGNVRALRNAARRVAVASRGLDELVVDNDLAASIEVPAMISDTTASDETTLFGLLERHGWNLAATAQACGISRTTLYARIDASPSIRKAGGLTADELRRSIEEHGRDLDALVRHLRVSRRGLQLRLRELGL